MDPLAPVDTEEGSALKADPRARNLALGVIGLQILVSLITYPFMPEQVPSHWNAAGQINGHTPRLINAILFPAISLGVYVLVRLLVAAGPRLGRVNQRATLTFLDRFFPVLFLFFLILQLATTAIGLGFPVDISFVITLAVSLLFVFIGNFMGKLRRNFWAGVRTPWTLASDTVWERTHRLGAWLFVIAGLLGIPLAFVPVPFVHIAWIAVSAIVIAIGLYIYSYLEYRRIEHGNPDGPLAPPFTRA